MKNDWYKLFKITSGGFVLPIGTSPLIEFFKSRILQKWNSSIDISRNSIKTIDFLGLNNYTPMEDSPYYMLGLNNKNDIVIQLTYRLYTTNKPTYIEGWSQELKNANLNINFGINMFINNNDHKRIKEKQITFYELFFNSRNNNIETTIEHEIGHIIKNILGYENNKNYIMPSRSPEDNTINPLYYIQTSELEAFYSELDSNIKLSIKNMQEPIEAINNLKRNLSIIRIKNKSMLKPFLLRIFGIINKMDRMYNDNEYWLSLKPLIIEIINNKNNTGV